MASHGLRVELRAKLTDGLCRWIRERERLAKSFDGLAAEYAREIAADELARIQDQSRFWHPWYEWAR